MRWSGQSLRPRPRHAPATASPPLLIAPSGTVAAGGDRPRMRARARAPCLVLGRMATALAPWGTAPHRAAPLPFSFRHACVSTVVSAPSVFALLCPSLRERLLSPVTAAAIYNCFHKRCESGERAAAAARVSIPMCTSLTHVPASRARLVAREPQLRAVAPASRLALADARCCAGVPVRLSPLRRPPWLVHRRHA
jgi:hypothetical protein